MALTKSKLFNSPKLDSRIKSANVTASERWLGFFASPALIYISYFVLSTTYLNQFYVDVLKLGGIAGGAFLVLLPVLSKIFDAITNLFMGMIIDRTKTRQGKARPWILISEPLMAITGIMLYWVPRASLMTQAIWVAIGYNLYFAFAFTIYNMSQTLLVPLATHNTKQRDSLALFLSMGQSMIPGSLVYIVVPLFLLPYMGADPARWAKVMSIISIIMLPGVLIQYYFTKERVTEDAAGTEPQKISLGQQLKTCFSDKYWVIYFLIWMFYQFGQNVFGAALNFFGNWVLGTYNDGTTITLMNAIGQAPMGIGVFLLWPIAKKLGKHRTLFFGMIAAAAGSFLVSMIPTNFGGVLGALAFKTFGMLPTYLFPAMMAEAMDHIEWKNGYRCDGFTATVSSVLLTIMTGAGVSVFNSGLHVGAANGYVEPFTGTDLNAIMSTIAEKGYAAQAALESYLPNSDGIYTVGVVQSAATARWITVSFALIPAITYVLIAILAFLYKVEDQVPQMTADISARHRAEAEARGEVYYSPEEKAAMEQAENDRIAEENRIKELKAKCAKKGLNFEEEEARYQAKLAEKKAKEEAKAARKNKK